MKKRIFITLAIFATLSACSRDSEVASRNLSAAAENFEIERRIVFYNGITNDYVLIIEGLCAINKMDLLKQLAVTCKTGAAEFKKHFLGLSDNVTYFVEQIDSSGVETYRYKVIFKPESIIPDVDLKIK